jgi:hypothetical protein
VEQRASPVFASSTTFCELGDQDEPRQLRKYQSFTSPAVLTGHRRNIFSQKIPAILCSVRTVEDAAKELHAGASMLRKCANPVCLASFRKLGTGKLFAFESAPGIKSVNWNPGAMSRSPVFFWLCEFCSLSFTLRPESGGQLTLQRVPDGVEVTVFDARPLDQGW